MQKTHTSSLLLHLATLVLVLHKNNNRHGMFESGAVNSSNKLQFIINNDNA